MQGCRFNIFTCAYCSLVSSHKQHVQINVMIITIITNVQKKKHKRKKDKWSFAVKAESEARSVIAVSHEYKRVI